MAGGLLGKDESSRTRYERTGPGPVIAMWANVFSDDMLRRRLAGMNAHLAKPLDMKKLWKQYKNACVPCSVGV